jgi:hypothetical protein
VLLVVSKFCSNLMDVQTMVDIEQAVLCIYNQALDRNTRQNANTFLDQATLKSQMC